MDSNSVTENTEFDKEVSDLNIYKFDPYNSVSADIIGGAVATVADTASSIWNSLTPERYNFETQDLLSRVSDNALRVYQENPDTIHAISFVTGAVTSGGGALKIMGALRSGAKGVSWFSEAGRLESLAKMDSLYREGVTATQEYKNARNLYYLRQAGNAVLDNAAMETALIGTMNAHPFMDDYNKDFVSNFVGGVALNPFSMAFHGVSHIVARAEVKGLEIGVSQEAKAALLNTGKIKEASSLDNLSNQIAARASNIKTWEDILQSAKDLEVGTGGVGPVRNLDQYTKEMAQSFIRTEQAAMKDTFDAMVSPAIREMPESYQASLLQKITNDPARFAGVDSIDFIKPTDASVLAQSKGKLYGTVQEITGNEIPFVTKDAKGNLIGNKIVFSPEDDSFYHLKDERSFARAIDLGYTPDNILKGMTKEYGMFPRIDWDVESFTKGTASIDAEYLKSIAYFDKMSDEDFAKAAFAVSPNDLPTLQGIYLRATRLVSENPDLAKDFKVAITKQLPNWDNIQVQAAKVQGVSSEYLKTLKTVESDFDAKYNIRNTKLSVQADESVRDWIRGNYTLRKEVASHFHSGHQSSVVNELYNSSASRALRDYFAKNADADGYVYLYRGQKQRAFTHATVASYTTNIAKAKEFGSVELYKIRPEEILTAFQDTAGFAGKGQNYEILVMSPTRETAKIVSSGKSGQESMQNIIANNSKKSNVYQDISGVLNTLNTAKITELKSLLQQGVPLRTISLHLNIPYDLVQALSSSQEVVTTIKNYSSVGELSPLANTMNMYSSASELANYMDNTKRSISMSTNMNKVPHALLKAQMDVQAGKDMNTYLIEEFYKQSNSQIVKQVESVVTDEVQKAWAARIRQGIDKITNETIGMKLFQSTDFALRKLGDLGTVISQSGKNFAFTVNKLAEGMLTPLATKFESLIKDEAAALEFKVAMNVEAGIKGYKEFNVDTGMWMKQSEVKPWNEIKDPKTGKVIAKEKNLEPVYYKGSPYVVVTPSVREIINDMHSLGREFYEMNSTIRQIRGLPSMTDIGFWRPAMNPRNKHIAYVFDALNYKTTMLYGNTKEELAEAMKLYRDAHPEDIVRGTTQIVDKSELARFNAIQGRHDPVFMEMADVNMLRTGSAASATTSASHEIFSELMGGYDHYIGYGVRQMFMDYNSDVFQHLEKMTNLAGNGIKDQPLGKVGKLQKPTSDAGSVIRNTLLGAADLKEYQGWSSLQDSLQAITETGLRIAADIIGPVLKPVSTGISSLLRKRTTEQDYIKLVHDMEVRGIRSPWEDVANDIAQKMYNVDSMAKIPGMTPRLIALGNSLASVSLLRVMELGQAVTNLISLPILMNSAITRQYDEMFLNGKIADNASFMGIKTMYNGVRRMNDPMMVKFDKYALDNGIYKPIVSEVNDILHKLYSFNPDKIHSVENALNSKTVELLSKPSDYSESLVRRWAYMTGIEMASTRYKDLSDVAKMTFARNFVDEVVGNYSAAQRPVIFQGNLGVAMGLFQTYIVTYGQSLFRHIENQDWQALSKMMLAQGTIFGAQSLPGFHQVSEYIGQHFSDNNIDLETGTYRALPNKLADIILYGLPSNLAPTFTTRGDIAPRIPNIAGGLQNLPTLQLLKSAYDASDRILQAALHTDDNTFRAIGEALSLQSLSRPIARLAELGTGSSITSKGNVVAGPDEVRSTQGVLARVFATRPLQELKMREAIHLNSMYGSLDYDARQEVTKQLKMHLRAGNLTGDVIDKLAEKYLRTGSPQGWRSAVNQAIGQAANPEDAAMNYLNPRSPTQLMINEMD